jgi:hypothetical protein
VPSARTTRQARVARVGRTRKQVEQAIVEALAKRKARRLLVALSHALAALTGRWDDLWTTGA